MSLFSTDPNELERRKKVWTAISDLWLDTELQAYDLDDIAGVLAESGYTDKELHHIYLYEVAPAVYTHLLTAVSPVWAGFDPEGLCPEIVRSLKKRTAFHKLMLKLRKKLMTYATKELWRQITKKVHALRKKISNPEIDHTKRTRIDCWLNSALKNNE